jgi:putative peptidoglycan lipid II flippase
MNLLRALLTVSGMTLVSRILGFLRDAIIAHLFGAGGATDAFFVAFRIPNLLRRLFAEGAFSQAFVPILAQTREREGDEATRSLIDGVASMLALALVVTSVAGVLAAPWVILLTAPGFAATPERFELTVAMLRVTFPYILFIALTAFAGAILNTWRRFAVPAFTPSLLNIAFIVGACLAAPWFDPPVKVLAWSALAGGVLQLGFQAGALARLGLLPAWVAAPWRVPGVRRVMRQMVPALLGVSVAQVSLLLNTVFASWLQPGSVSWLNYADRLMEFPTGLLGAALGTILLPSLARHHAADDHEGYSKALDWGLRVTLLLALPAALGLALLATPLIATLFLHGAFSAHDLAMTRTALMAYSAGLAGLILVKVLAPAFYARQDIRTPVRIAIATLVLTQLLNLAFIGPLGHAGLALAIGLGACLNAALLFALLRTRGHFAPQPGWTGFALRLLVALAVMGLVLEWLSPAADWWLAARTIVRAGALVGVVAAGALAYFAVLGLFGFRPRDFARRAA